MSCKVSNQLRSELSSDRISSSCSGIRTSWGSSSTRYLPCPAPKTAFRIPKLASNPRWSQMLLGTISKFICSICWLMRRCWWRRDLGFWFWGVWAWISICRGGRATYRHCACRSYMMSLSFMRTKLISRIGSPRFTEGVIGIQSSNWLKPYLYKSKKPLACKCLTNATCWRPHLKNWQHWSLFSPRFKTTTPLISQDYSLSCSY